MNEYMRGYRNALDDVERMSSDSNVVMNNQRLIGVQTGLEYALDIIRGNKRDWNSVCPECIHTIEDIQKALMDYLNRNLSGIVMFEAGKVTGIRIARGAIKGDKLQEEAEKELGGNGRLLIDEIRESLLNAWNEGASYGRRMAFEEFGIHERTGIAGEPQ